MIRFSPFSACCRIASILNDFVLSPHTGWSIQRRSKIGLVHSLPLHFSFAKSKFKLKMCSAIKLKSTFDNDGSVINLQVGQKIRKQSCTIKVHNNQNTSKCHCIQLIHSNIADAFRASHKLQCVVRPRFIDDSLLLLVLNQLQIQLKITKTQ